ncbi:MAG: IS21 family transposase [Dehalococcoidia bacterium]
MLEVDQVKECKQLRSKGMGIRAISRKLKIARNTVRDYLRSDRLPGKYQMSAAREQPVRAAIQRRVRELLEEEIRIETPRKQRLTAARIYRILGQEERPGSESTVRQVVRELRLELRDPLKHAYLPLEYEPGVDAQVDFFEGVADDRKLGRVKVHILLVRACYSGRTFAYVAPNQTREALLEGLMQAFEFFGGVFRTIWFDNLTPAVKKVLKGRDRVLQRAFECFQAHYGFEAVFCSPGKGNEKGGVEGKVKYSRHEILSPIPEIDGREDVQQLAQEWMEREPKRTLAGRPRTIGEMWAEEVPNLMPCPELRFEAGRVRSTKVTPRSWVPFGTNFYSAPVEWVGHEVDLRIEAEQVVIRRRNGQVVRHRRRYGRGEMSLELDHYLPLLERKHRGLDRAVPVKRWLEKVPGCWSAFLKALRRRDGEVAGSKAFIDALFLCRVWDTDAVTKAVEQALRHPEVSLGTLRYHLWRHREAETPRPGAIAVEGPTVLECHASAYMSLCMQEEGGHD